MNKVKKHKKLSKKVEFWSRKVRHLSILLYIIGSICFFAGTQKLLNKWLADEENFIYTSSEKINNQSNHNTSNSDHQNGQWVIISRQRNMRWNNKDIRKNNAPYDYNKHRKPRPDNHNKHHKPRCIASLIVMGVFTMILSILGFKSLRNPSEKRARVLKCIGYLWHLIVFIKIHALIIHKAAQVIRQVLKGNNVHSFIEKHRFIIPLTFIGQLIFCFQLLWAIRTLQKYHKVIAKQEKKFGTKNLLISDEKSNEKKKEKKEKKEKNKNKEKKEKKNKNPVEQVCVNCKCKQESDPEKEIKYGRVNNLQTQTNVRTNNTSTQSKINTNNCDQQTQYPKNNKSPFGYPSNPQIETQRVNNINQPSNISSPFGVPTVTSQQPRDFVPQKQTQPVKHVKNEQIDIKNEQIDIKNEQLDIKNEQLDAKNEQIDVKKWTTPMSYNEFRVNSVQTPELGNINQAQRPFDHKDTQYRPPTFD